MQDSAADEPPNTSIPLQDATAASNDQHPPADLTISTKSNEVPPEPFTIPSNRSDVCFNVSSQSQDYNADWPALPGTTVTGPSPSAPTEDDDKQNAEDIDNLRPNTPSPDETAVSFLPEGEQRQENPPEEGFQECSPEEVCPTVTDYSSINVDNGQQTSPLPNPTDQNSPMSFNLYQRQANIYSAANLHPYPAMVHAHHSAPEIQPPVELQGQIYYNLGHGTGINYPPPATGMQFMQMPMPNYLPPQPPPPPPLHFQNQAEGIYSHHHYPQVPLQELQEIDGHHQDNPPPFQTFNVIVPQPVYYGFPEPGKEDHQHHTCCGGESASGQCQCQVGMGGVPTTPRKEENLLQIKIPSWAKLNLDEEENTCLHPLSTSSRSSSRPRLVEYIGDMYHEKNPHTRRTILLNQRRSSDNDPIVFYRFYQFSCSCLGKVWFSPLHRAREGCYCRDCHKFVKPFGHVSTIPLLELFMLNHDRINGITIFFRLTD